MRRTFLAVLTVILSVGLSARAANPAQAPEKTHPLTIHDMLAMDRISDSKVSPDGKWIVFNVRQTDLEANRGRTDLWLVGTDGKGLRRLTNHPAADFNGRWTPCGQWVFFLSTRSGSSQVWRIKVDGGEAEQVTHLPLDVGSLVLTKGLLAVTMEVFPGTTPAETAAQARRDRKGQSHRPSLREALRPPLGHLERRPPLAPLRRPDARERRSQGPDAGHGRRHAQQALRRPGGDRLHSRREGPRLHGQGCRPRGGLVHGLRPLLCPGRRLSGPEMPDGSQPGPGYDARVLARRQDPGLSGHVPAPVRGRPLPHRPQGLARRRGARPDRGLGLFGLIAGLGQGRDRGFWSRRPTRARPRSSPSTPRPERRRRSSRRAPWARSRPRPRGSSSSGTP